MSLDLDKYLVEKFNAQYAQDSSIVFDESWKTKYIEDVKSGKIQDTQLSQMLAEIEDNYKDLEALSAGFDPLKDKESNKYYDSLDIQPSKYKPAGDKSQDFDNKSFKKEMYKQSVEDAIATLSVDENFSKLSPDQKKQAFENAFRDSAYEGFYNTVASQYGINVEAGKKSKKTDKIINNILSGKQKANISQEVAGANVGAKFADVQKKAQRTGIKGFVDKLKAKDEALKEKYGWKYTVAMNIIKAGGAASVGTVALGGAYVGLAGLSVYKTWEAINRSRDNFKKHKAAGGTEKNWKEYITKKENRSEAVGLLLSGVGSAVSLYSVIPATDIVNALSGVSTSMGVDTSSMLVRTTRAGVALAAGFNTGVSALVKARKETDKKAKRRLRKQAFTTMGLGVAGACLSFFSKEIADSPLAKSFQEKLGMGVDAITGESIKAPEDLKPMTSMGLDKVEEIKIEKIQEGVLAPDGSQMQKGDFVHPSLKATPFHEDILNKLSEGNENPESLGPVLGEQVEVDAYEMQSSPKQIERMFNANPKEVNDILKETRGEGFEWKNSKELTEMLAKGELTQDELKLLDKATLEDFDAQGKIKDGSELNEVYSKPEELKPMSPKGLDVEEVDADADIIPQERIDALKAKGLDTQQVKAEIKDAIKGEVKDEVLDSVTEEVSSQDKDAQDVSQQETGYDVVAAVDRNGISGTYSIDANGVATYDAELNMMEYDRGDLTSELLSGKTVDVDGTYNYGTNTRGDALGSSPDSVNAIIEMQANAKKIIIEDIIAQDIQERVSTGYELSEGEKAFLKSHQETLDKYNLSRNDNGDLEYKSPLDIAKDKALESGGKIDRGEHKRLEKIAGHRISDDQIDAWEDEHKARIEDAKAKLKAEKVAAKAAKKVAESNVNQTFSKPTNTLG